MFNEFDNEFGYLGFDINPGRQTFAGFGYDRESYISTAQLVPSPYTSQALIQAKFNSQSDFIAAVDDTGIGQIIGPALINLNNIIQNVTTEINGYLSSIYPMPLAQTGTVAVVQVTGVSTDGLGTITSISMLENGNYNTAPATTQNPVYLRYIDPLANIYFWGQNWFNCQLGTGAILNVTYAPVNYSDESGQLLQAQSVTGTPTITNGGTGYNQYDLLVLTGGSSFVPAKIREAALVLICHSLYLRRLTPDEKNLYAPMAKFWREFFRDIGEGDKQLDGTYKRFFSAGAVWGQRSVLFGANSL